jgi:plastocyanin
VRTRNRFARGCSQWAWLVAGAALGVMLGSTAIFAGPTSPPIAAGGPQLTAASTKTLSGPRIEIKAHQFSLPTVSIPVGGTVTWVNHDDDVHTVVSTTALFRSPGLDTDNSFSYRFTQPGTYQYFCTLHPLMVGKVIVR